MKKIISILFSICVVMLVIGCDKTVGKINFLDGKKVLIVYYSYSGNTKNVAEQIHSIVGGDMLEIVPVEKYSSDYNKALERAKQEIDNRVRPKIEKSNVDTRSYDVIFIGTPVWHGTMAPPIKTFLLQYNLSKSLFIPFCTHGSDGEADIFWEIRKLQPVAKFLKGFSIYQNDSKNCKKDIKNWLLTLQEKMQKK